jgi:hypothetical protein
MGTHSKSFSLNAKSASCLDLGNGYASLVFTRVLAHDLSLPRKADGVPPYIALQITGSVDALYDTYKLEPRHIAPLIELTKHTYKAGDQRAAIDDLPSKNEIVLCGEEKGIDCVKFIPSTKDHGPHMYSAPHVIKQIAEWLEDVEEICKKHGGF